MRTSRAVAGVDGAGVDGAGVDGAGVECAGDGRGMSIDDVAGTSLDERVLDGAEQAFSRFGVRACTMEQIAREAGVSRITVYRHVGPKDEVFRQVVLRNTRRYFTLLEHDFGQAASLADVVRSVFRRAQASYRGNRLYRTLLELEPETVLRWQTTHARAFYEQGVPFALPHLARFLPEGSDAAIAAEWIVRTTISVVGTAGYLLDPYDPDDLERLVALTTYGLVEGVPGGVRSGSGGGVRAALGEER